MIHANLTSAFLPIGWGPFQDVNLLYFLSWNGCNVFNIVGKPLKDININLSFLSSRWKVMEWTPQIWHLMEILEILLYHIWSNRYMQIFHNTFFPSAEGHLKMLIYSIGLLKMQIWNGCNVLNIAGISMKDININLSFLSSRWKVVEWTFPGLEHFLNVFLSWGWKVVDWTFPRLENFLNAFLSSGSKVVEWTPRDLTSGGNV